MSKKGRALFLSIFFLLLPCLNRASAAESHWQRLAEQDLQAIHYHLKTETVAALDNTSEFSRWLNTGYQQALVRTNKVNSYAGYVAIIRYYVAGFHDYHIFVRSLDWPGETKYPGFVLQYYEGGFVVSRYGHHSAQLPVGAKLLSCGGQPPWQWMLKSVFPYYGNAALPSSWLAQTPKLLIDDANPWVMLPKQCQFMIGGKKESIRLSWQSIGLKKLSLWVNLAAYSYQPKDYSVKVLPHALLWVTYPTFFPKTSAQLKAAKAINALMLKSRKMESIVFDVRGNGGGNSAWGNDILRNLYGKSYFQWVDEENSRGYNQYRVTAALVKKFYLFYQRNVNNFGVSSQQAKEAKQSYDEVKRAYHKGEVLYPPVPKSSQLHKSEKTPKPQYRGRLIIVMDGRCNSSCLTFIARAKHFPGVILVGQPSGADTIYTDSWVVKLPSGRYLNFALSANRHRERPSNVPYRPNYLFPGDINDTKALQGWVGRLFS